MALESLAPQHMALLPGNLRKLYLEDHSIVKYLESEVNPEFPRTLEDLFLDVPWGLNCPSYPVSLVSLTVKLAKRPTRTSIPVLPPNLKYLALRVGFPLEESHLAQLPPRLEYLECYQGDWTQKGISMLPKTLRIYSFTSVKDSWLLPPQMESLGYRNLPMKAPLPAALKSANVYELTEQTVPFLPPNLIKLSIARNFTPGALAGLPSRLQTFHCKKAAPLTIEQLELLPKSLTSLACELNANAEWTAKSFAPSLTCLDMIAQVSIHSVKSLASLKQLTSLILVPDGSGFTDLNAGCFEHLPRTLTELFIPLKGVLEGVDLPKLPRHLTELSLRPSLDGACCHLTNLDFEIFWPRGLVVALLPPFSNPSFPVPDKVFLSLTLPINCRSVSCWPRSTSMHQRTTAHEEVQWGENFWTPRLPIAEFGHENDAMAQELGLLDGAYGYM
jgi:hypothetical protein